jgi:CRISPR-associated protein Cmr6
MTEDEKVEKGILLIHKTKKGFRSDIQRSGKSSIPIKVPNLFKDNKLNGINCFFIAKQGNIIHLETESGEVIYLKETTTPKKESPSSSSKIRKLPDSFDMSKTFLPSDVRELQIKDIDNFYLKLNKAARYDESDDKFKFFQRDRKKGNYEIDANFGEISHKLGDISKRQYSQAKALCLDYKSLKLKPDWRLIVGLGGESVYKTSMTLHHIYGIPYIPASAVKGITRQWAINSNPEFELTEAEREKKRFKNSEEKAFKQSEELCDIFGCDEKSIYEEARIGNIIFFDAFPTELNNKSIQPDVINVHYPNYYGKNDPPTDTQNPNPIFFLIVQDTPFQFIIGIKPNHSLPIEKGKRLLEKTTKYLQDALTEHGIGAKTAVGYGYMLG